MNPLEHLGRALLGIRYCPESVFTMMTCYFDEAGGSDLKWTYVCGYAASVYQWDRFEVDWKILLSKYDLPYFHMKECSQFKGPFAKWKGHDLPRITFLRTAAEIIRSNVQQSFVSLISHEIFNQADQIYKFRKVLRSPYALAGRACIEAAYEWKGASLEMKFIFEDGCPDKEGLIHSMTSCLPHRGAPSFEPSRNFLPSVEWPDGRIGIIPLQAADFLAYESRKMLADRLRDRSSKLRKSMLAISKNIPVSLSLLTPDVIDRICMESSIERRIR